MIDPHPQTNTRRKYERIRCPYCNSLSHIVHNTYGLETRECNQGHFFFYSYTEEMLEQLDINYKTGGPFKA